MTLDQYANIAEIIGVIIVVVTLLYLSVQVRQNTIALRSSTTHSVQAQIATNYGLIAADPELMGILLKGMQKPSALSALETGRFMAWWSIALYAWQNIYYQMLSGAYEKPIFDGFMRLLAGASSSPGFRTVWEQRKFILSTDFQEYVEAEVFTQKISGYQILGVLGVPDDHSSDE